MKELDKYKIEKQFEKETGISRDLICELREAFPASNLCHILLLNREFQFLITPSGKAIKKNSIFEVK